MCVSAQCSEVCFQWSCTHRCSCNAKIQFPQHAEIEIQSIKENYHHSRMRSTMAQIHRQMSTGSPVWSPNEYGTIQHQYIERPYVLYPIRTHRNANVYRRTHFVVQTSLSEQQYPYHTHTRIHYLTIFSVVAVYQHHRILCSIILHINAFLVEHVCFVNSPSQSLWSNGVTDCNIFTAIIWMI